jgi:chaperone BCS1
LSLSIAGHFGLDIYILNLSDINKAILESLFAKLPSHCVILLEDIDAVSSKRSGDAETKDSRQIATGSPSRESKSGKVSLSALLNVIDGIGSQEGRILIMTTNYITRLDEALIRPGRVDKNVELGLADKKMTADIFRLIFKPVEGDVGPLENAQSDGLVGEDGKVLEAAWSQNEEAEVERLAEQFAAKVPELKFSPAEIQSFLLVNKQSPVMAVANVDQWMTKIMDERKKAKNELQVTPKSPEPAGASESAKPSALGDALPETARASKPEFKTEVYVSNGL